MMIRASIASKLRLEIMSLETPPGMFMFFKSNTFIENKLVICRFPDLQLHRPVSRLRVVLKLVVWNLIRISSDHGTE